MTPSWLVTQEKVKKTIDKICKISNPKKIILFGSYITGNLTINSDLDILVVSNNDDINTRKESVRIRRALKGIMMSIDILVVKENILKELVKKPGLIYRDIINNGKIVYET